VNGRLPEPEALRGRLGREEFTQRLLTCLILGRVERGWNIRREPSAAGASFLRQLHSLAFDAHSTPHDPPLFVDELELPKRSDSEPSGWPDYGVVWPERLFIVELKTERRSHRPAQIPYYLELARHWHSGRHVDLLYLTPTMPVVTTPACGHRQRAVHLTWLDVAPLVAAVWESSDIREERTIATYLRDLIESIETAALQAPRPAAPPVQPSPAEPLPPASGSDVDNGLRLAAETERDAVQRALPAELDDPADLDSLRLELRQRLVTAPTVDGVVLRHVLPWLWRAQTSGGRAMTEAGDHCGYEVRLSRYERDVTTTR
jgi:hypothetical protein